MTDAQTGSTDTPEPEVAVLGRLMPLKEGDAFLVADPLGDMSGGADGFFLRDTRILSRLRLLIGNAQRFRQGTIKQGGDATVIAQMIEAHGRAVIGGAHEAAYRGCAAAAQVSAGR